MTDQGHPNCEMCQRAVQHEMNMLAPRMTERQRRKVERMLKAVYSTAAPAVRKTQKVAKSALDAAKLVPRAVKSLPGLFKMKRRADAPKPFDPTLNPRKKQIPETFKAIRPDRTIRILQEMQSITGSLTESEALLIKYVEAIAIEVNEADGDGTFLYEQAMDDERLHPTDKILLDRAVNEMQAKVDAIEAAKPRFEMPDAGFAPGPRLLEWSAEVEKILAGDTE